MPTPKIGDVHRTSERRPIRASNKINCHRNPDEKMTELDAKCKVHALINNASLKRLMRLGRLLHCAASLSLT
jgi:hypothetical protein